MRSGTIKCLVMICAARNLSSTPPIPLACSAFTACLSVLRPCRCFLSCLALASLQRSLPGPHSQGDRRPLSIIKEARKSLHIIQIVLALRLSSFSPHRTTLTNTNKPRHALVCLDSPDQPARGRTDPHGRASLEGVAEESEGTAAVRAGHQRVQDR